MQLSYHTLTDAWNCPLRTDLDAKNTLVIVFGTSKVDHIMTPIKQLIAAFPNSTIIGASSAGEIAQDELLEDSIVVAILAFEHTTIKHVCHPVASAQSSFEDGRVVADSLLDDDLKVVFVLSDGLNINGSQLTKGLSSVFTDKVIVTGGLAGDDDRFENTWVIVDGELKSHYVTAIGLYGEHVHAAYGSKGGWDKLGIARKVTRSIDNVLYEIDNQPALEIYKQYLGDKAEGLPATGLLFPLQLDEPYAKGETKVRTILAVNEDEQSITFAGDIPEGSLVSLMKANYDRLVDGALGAAEQIELPGYKDEDILSIAISCVGRRLVLKQRTEEELEATKEVLPENTTQIGFYSYGEISPLTNGTCDLHNQTMTLTLIWETNASTA
jgi:hypothetical protein